MTHGATRLLLAVAFVVAVSAVQSWVALGATQAVSIVDFNFEPRTQTINVGDAITWTNHGGEAHTATSNTSAFDTGVLNSGASKMVAFGAAGTYQYHCAIHTFMTGTVTVLAPAATTAPPPAPPPTPTRPPPPPTTAPTTAPPPPPTVAPTTATPATAAPTTVAPTASASPTPSVAPTTAPVAVASPGATTPFTTPSPTPAPAASGDTGPLPLLLGVVVVAGIAGVALYVVRRR